MEKEKKKVNIVLIIIAILLVVLIVIGGLVLTKLSNEDTEETISDITNNKDNTSKSGANKKEDSKTSMLSFKQMDAADTSLTDEQKVIAKFFDDDYFSVPSYEELVRYADILKNMSISFEGEVRMILSADSENFEAVCQWASVGNFFGIDTLPLNSPIIIKGKKPERMVIEGDALSIKGKLVGAETRNINGETKYLPIVEIIECNTGNLWHSEDEMRQVAKVVFGNNIKVRKPTDDEVEDMVYNYFYTYQNYIWLVEFENQSNLNFKVFDIWQSEPTGQITYNALYNQGIEKDYLNKSLFITPDLQNYIVFDMSRKDKYVYINVYDRNLNKLWQREISNASQITWDATNSNLVFISDNDFYNINIENGENIFEPIYVGKKQEVRIVDNGYILLNYDSDDAIMFLDKNGKIKNKFDINLGDEIYSSAIQKVDNNYVILYEMYGLESAYSKYIIIDEDGNKIKEST